MISGRPQKAVPYIVTESSNFFMVGDTVYLVHDDGAKNPWFSRDSTVSSRYAHNVYPLHIENISNATGVGNMKYRDAETGSKLVLMDREDYEDCINLRDFRESISYIVKTGEEYDRYRAYDSLDRELGACWGCLDSVNVEYYVRSINNKGRIAEQSGEEEMTDEEVNRPEYVIIVKNTEVFKKGGVFKYYGSFYAPVDAKQAYAVRPYGDDYIRHEQVDLLLEKKIAVEAVQFNPAFVTLEQNEVLQNALTSMTKKTAKKKTVAKKSK